MSDRLAVLPQYLLPKQLITRALGRAASGEGGAATTAVIRWFVRRYGVDMDEAAEPDPARYATFNAFFTRALAPGARPLADDPRAFLSPADGTLQRLTEGRAPSRDAVSRPADEGR